MGPQQDETKMKRMKVSSGIKVVVIDAMAL